MREKTYDIYMRLKKNLKPEHITHFGLSPTKRIRVNGNNKNVARHKALSNFMYKKCYVITEIIEL